MKRILIATVLGGLFLASAPAQAERTVGLMQHDGGVFPSYTLFSSLGYPEVFLIDEYGYLINSWPTTFVSGNANYLMDNGDLLRCVDPGGNDVFVAGGDAGMAQRLDWDGNLVWEFLYSDETVRHHHDIAPLPNGNVLMIAWEYRTSAQAVQAGRDPGFLEDGELWPEHIIEVEPDGFGSATIVWEWHVWDHLIQDFDASKDNFGVIAEHSERIDINGGVSGADWLHSNAIDYNPELDQIILSAPRFNEFWIIDHSTTTAEAAGTTGGNSGMGGDILYRWGNPQAYDSGINDDQRLWGQHDVEWIDAGLPGGGNVLVYNNGNGRPAGNYSTVEEIVTTVDEFGNYPQPATGVAHAPAEALWTYDPVDQFYSGGLSSAERLPNGNTSICVGRDGDFFEIDTNETRIWTYENPINGSGRITQGDPATGNTAFRAERYPIDFAGFIGKDMTPGTTVELYNPVSIESDAGLAQIERLTNSPNPVRTSTVFEFRIAESSPVTLEVFDARGRFVDRVFDGALDSGDHGVEWQPESLPTGVYHYVLTLGTERVTRKLLLFR